MADVKVRVRIRERNTTRVAVQPWSEPNLLAEDRDLLLLVLAREVRNRRLPYGVSGYRIEAWHPRRGWLEYSL